MLYILLIIALAVLVLAWLILLIPLIIETHRMGKQLRELKREEAKRKQAS